MNQAKIKKIIRIVGIVLAWVIVAISVFMMIFTIVSVSVFDRNDRDLFGYKAFIVKSDSMAATDFKAGDLIFVKEVDVEDLDVGDIITFQTTDPDFYRNGENTYGIIVTHKIRYVHNDGNGNISFTTYGTTNDVDDKEPVSASFVLGQYQGGKLPGVGIFFNYLRSTPGYFVCILIPFLLLLIIQGANTVKLFKKYKKEQMADIEEERRKVAEEREEAQRLLAELRAMKGESGCDGTSESCPQAPDETPPAEDGENQN